MLSHVLFVASGAATDALVLHQLRQAEYQIHRAAPTQAVAWTRQHLPNLIVWSDSATPPTQGFRDFRLCEQTWNIPIVQLVSSFRSEQSDQELVVEPDARLLASRESDLNETICQAVAARDDRFRQGVQAELSLRFPSAFDQLGRLGVVMSDWFTLCGLKTSQSQHTIQAVGELAANAIEWGHRHERSRLVHVCSWLEEDRVGVLVCDSGPGFDRRNLPHAARPGDSFSHLDVRATCNLRTGGFGILKASELVDHLCFNEKGNEGLVIKFLPRSPLTGQTRPTDHRTTNLAC